MKYNDMLTVRLDNKEKMAFTDKCNEKAQNKQEVLRRLIRLYVAGEISFNHK